MMSDAKIMTLNDLNGSEQFTKDYAPYRAVERSVNRGERGGEEAIVATIYPTSVGSRLGKERFEAKFWSL